MGQGIQIPGGAMAGENQEMVANIVDKGKFKILILIKINRPKTGNIIQGIGEIKFSDGRLY